MKTLALVALLALAGCSAPDRRIFEPENLFSPYQPGDFFTDDRYDRLVFEVLEVDGAQAHSGHLDEIVAMARAQLSGSKESVAIVRSGAIQAELEPTRRWEKEDLQRFERKHARFTERGALVVRLLYVRGTFHEAPEFTSAVAFGPHSIAFFEPIRQTNGAAVHVHELGHLLGLVAQGTPDRHGHGDGHGHCSNTACAMFRAAASTKFCTECEHDLHKRWK